MEHVIRSVNAQHAFLLDRTAVEQCAVAQCEGDDHYHHHLLLMQCGCEFHALTCTATIAGSCT
jgi:hypothetical protein